MPENDPQVIADLINTGKPVKLAAIPTEFAGAVLAELSKYHHPETGRILRLTVVHDSVCPVVDQSAVSKACLCEHVSIIIQAGKG